MAVPVDPHGTVAIEKATHLFTAPGFAPPPNQIGYYYDVTADGQQVLFSLTPGASDQTAPITVVVNWTAGLRTNP